MDPQGRLTCAELLTHPYFDMYDKMMDSMKDEHKPKPRRSHGNRDKNNSKDNSEFYILLFLLVYIHSTSLFRIFHSTHIAQKCKLWHPRNSKEWLALKMHQSRILGVSFKARHSFEFLGWIFESWNSKEWDGF